MPLVGGVVTSTLREVLVYPALCCLWRARQLKPPPVA
jgi:Cu(I)/Ag(I) efflux system membrane protein CusA/SilA